MTREETTQRIWILVWVLVSSFFILYLIDSIHKTEYTILKSSAILVHVINLILQLLKISYLTRED